jgi:hypothetical protein
MKLSLLLEEVHKFLHFVNRHKIDDVSIQCAYECMCVSKCLCVVTVYDIIPHLVFHIHIPSSTISTVFFILSASLKTPRRQLWKL